MGCCRGDAKIVTSRMWGYVDFGRGEMTGNVSPTRRLRDLISRHHVKNLDVKIDFTCIRLFVYMNTMVD